MAPTPTIDFIGIGAMRSGTTWLANCLRLHAEICVSEPKEVRYFNRQMLQGQRHAVNSNHAKPLSWYLNHFRHGRPHQIRGEFSPIYLYDVAAPAAIKRQFPDVKLLVCLRNPIDRAYSHYRMHRGGGLIGEMTFEDAIREERAYIEMGYYAQLLKRYLDYFSREQLLILLADDMKRQPEEELKKVLRFLNVDAEIAPRILNGYANPPTAIRSNRVKRFLHTGSRTLVNLKLSGVLSALRTLGIHRLLTRLNGSSFESPEISPDTRQYLQDVFKDRNRELEALLQRSVAHWV